MSPDYQIPGRVPEDGVQRQTFTDYWNERYKSEPYYDNEMFFDDYEPAYRMGHESRAQQITRAYEEVERELQDRWLAERGKSRLEWERAQLAVRRGWDDALLADPRLDDRNR